MLCCKLYQHSQYVSETKECLENQILPTSKPYQQEHRGTIVTRHFNQPGYTVQQAVCNHRTGVRLGRWCPPPIIEQVFGWDVGALLQS